MSHQDNDSAVRDITGTTVSDMVHATPEWWNTWVVYPSENGRWRYVVYQRHKRDLGGCYNVKLFAIIRAKKMNRIFGKNPHAISAFSWEPK